MSVVTKLKVPRKNKTPNNTENFHCDAYNLTTAPCEKFESSENTLYALLLKLNFIGKIIGHREVKVSINGFCAKLGKNLEKRKCFL